MKKKQKRKPLEQLNSTEFDYIAEATVYCFNLDRKGRKMEVVDMKHCLIKWWSENKKNFSAYKSMTGIAKLLCVHHSSINHLQKHRKKSLCYEENTKEVRLFLNGEDKKYYQYGV